MTRSAVIFDLDGTLTRPYLDFDRIRAEIGIKSGPILEAIAAMPSSAQPAAHEILLRHEWDAARNVELHEGAVEAVARCRDAGHRTALLTRNTRPIVDYIIDEHGFVFDALRTREDGAIKPSPEPVYSICEELDADPRQSWVVGDYLFDLQSGRSAGTRTVLMIGDDEVPDFASLADHVIRRLHELAAIVPPRAVSRT
jgi:HAD superfamily hydrolase (TIGR01509 family)